MARVQPEVGGAFSGRFEAELVVHIHPATGPFASASICVNSRGFEGFPFLCLHSLARSFFGKGMEARELPNHNDFAFIS